MLRRIVPVVDTATDGQLLIGTGIVVSPTAVITCRHVVDSYNEMGLVADPFVPEIGVISDSKFCRPARVSAFAGWDLCCLHFDSLPGTSPATLFRIAKLTPMTVAAEGFVAGVSGPEKHDLLEFQAILDDQYRGWLQKAQLQGSAPTCFSGGPVFAGDSEDGFLIGMLQLGGEEAVFSQLIAVDPIARFLAEEGIQAAIAEVSPKMQSAGEQPSKVKVRVGGKVVRSGLWLSGNDVDVNVEKDICRSTLRIQGETAGGSVSPKSNRRRNKNRD
jgi:hypothetical protein